MLCFSKLTNPCGYEIATMPGSAPLFLYKEIIVVFRMSCGIRPLLFQHINTTSCRRGSKKDLHWRNKSSVTAWPWCFPRSRFNYGFTEFFNNYFTEFFFESLYRSSIVGRLSMSLSASSITIFCLEYKKSVGSIYLNALLYYFGFHR